MFVHVPRREKVTKAAVPAQQAVFHAAARVKGDIAKYLEKAFKDLEKNFDVNKAAKIIREAPIGEAEIVTTQMAGSEAAIVGMSKELQKGMEIGGRQAAKELGQVVNLNLVRPGVIDWLKDHVGFLIVEMEDDQREKVRSIIEQGFLHNRHPLQIAKTVKGSIGLNSRLAKAVDNRFYKLMADPNISVERALELTEQYRQKLLNYRSKMIARTEAMDAINTGRQEMWMQLQDAGALDLDQEKEWLTAGDNRVSKKICVPMNHQRQLIDQPFTTGDGREIMQPTAHPQCRCTVALVRKKRTS